MPAHRSSAEAEVRDAVVARLRQLRPNARIMHEVNASGFGNRIDVLAVGHAEIIAVEVKSEKDKLDRLPNQVTAMQSVAHTAIAALHEKFLIRTEVRGKDWFSEPKESRNAVVWAFPENVDRGGFGLSRWPEPMLRPMTPLPPTAIHILWADELRQLCASLGVPAKARDTMPFMVASLRWRATGEQITKGICAQLRARRCIEADPAIEVAA